MLIVKKLPGGKLRVPKRAEDNATQTLGDGTADIGPTDPAYPSWLDYLERTEQIQQSGCAECPAPMIR